MTDNFHEKQIQKTTRQLNGDDDPPRVGVHVMSEFVYCERAGQLAALMRREDDGTEFLAAPALGGIADCFEVDDLGIKLEEFTRSLRNVAFLFAGVAMIITIVPIYDQALAIVLGTGAAIGFVLTGRLWWWSELNKLLLCKQRLRQARRAAKREPNWELHTQQEVNWWELLQSGWDSRQLKQSLYCPTLNLAGKPWRILHLGEKHLPVIQIRWEEPAPNLPTQVLLREQQRARIAAYSYLIGTCERGRAEWAIVLFNHSDVGIAVPLSESDWQAFRNGLRLARQELRSLGNSPRYLPSPPEGRKPCIRCPLGRPRPVGREPTVLAGTPIPPYVTSGRDGRRIYHSTCGDRFQDVPPHETAQRLGLLD